MAGVNKAACLIVGSMSSVLAMSTKVADEYLYIKDRVRKIRAEENRDPWDPFNPPPQPAQPPLPWYAPPGSEPYPD